MGISVNMYAFSKYANSTEQPAGAGTSFDCVLKDTSGVINPTIALKLDMSFNVSAYNYAYIPDFERYYFVREWTWERGLWVASLEVDVLATYKAQIGVSSQYVLRSSAASDGAILDTAYPATADITLSSSEINSPWAQAIESGYYVLGIINSADDTIGAVSYYVFTNQQLRNLCKEIMGYTDWLNVPSEEISRELLQALFNPFQYIVSALWFPINPGGTRVTTIPFGWWSFNLEAKKLDAPTKTYAYTFAIPKHPLAQSRGKYLNLSPYTSYVLNFEPFGSMPLDTTFMANAVNVFTVVQIDFISGDGFLDISNGNSLTDKIACNSAKCAVPIQLAQISQDLLAMQTATAVTAGNAVSNVMRLDVGGAMSDTASDIDTAVRASMPQLITSGSNGSFARFFYFKPFLQGKFFNVVQEFNEKRGRPLCQTRQINTIPGFIMCLDAEVSTVSTQVENELIKSYMEGGFYYG